MPPIRAEPERMESAAAGLAGARPQPVGCISSNRESRGGPRSQSTRPPRRSCRDRPPMNPARREREREVVLALGADVVVLLQVSRQQGGPAGGALGEDPSRDAAFLFRKIVFAILSFVPGHRANPENTLSEPGAWFVMLRACILEPGTRSLMQEPGEPRSPASCRPAPRAPWITARAGARWSCTPAGDPEETLRALRGRPRRAPDRAGGQRRSALDPLRRGAPPRRMSSTAC